ncbi:MAG: guanylate kinase, partial [Tissierellia bacterium]|nr:guanylate kinase [Tissierellia bacterium]
IDGDDYFYLDKEKFEKDIKDGKFLEYAEVHGNMYGTPKDFVMNGIDNGEIIVLEIDVQGALQVKKNYPNGVFVFLLPPSLSELERRLTHRGTESDEQIELRLNNAKAEISKINEYQYAVFNDTVENAVKNIEHIIAAEKLRVINNDSLEYYLKEEIK